MKTYTRNFDYPRSVLNLPATACFLMACILLNLGQLFLTALSAMTAEESEYSASANNRLIPLMVHLEQALHFGQSDEQTILAPPGMYLVESLTQGEPQLIFWDEHGKITLQATRTTHDQRVERPEAHLIREDAQEDIYHVVVFIPDGTALEATGSVSGIQTRGPSRVTRHYRLDPATGVVQFGNGQQGRRLPTGQSNISAQYREGSGTQGSELNMIQLQAVASQRQTALTLAQNILNSLNGRFRLEDSIDRPGNDLFIPIISFRVKRFSECR